jgi:hypothetical protein
VKEQMNIRDLIPYLDKESLKECLGSDAFIVPFNPYNRRYPSRTTFHSYDVDLAKWVSQQVDRVTLPKLKATKRREVILQKHFPLSEPILLFVISIPVNLVLSIIAGFIVNLRAKGQFNGILIVKLNHKGDIETCNDETGNIVSNEKVREIISNLRVAPSYSTPKADSELPVPIHLEHTSKVVGWGTISQDEQGILLEKVRIDDEVTLRQIKSGQLVGMSIGGIAKEYECSVCHKSYFKCNHIKGNIYNGQEAHCIIKNLDLAEISIVSDPANADCRISDLEVQPTTGFKRKC